MLSKITVSPAPHISQKLSTQRVMLDVIIGLAPAVIAAAIFFRLQAVLVMATCVASCMFFEWLCNVIRKKDNSLGDLSAVVTGLILAMSLPPSIPLWAVVIGSGFAMIIAKMLFGGLGSNIFNPAMAARAFLTASFGALMTTWTVPATVDASMPQIGPTNTTAITQATPLGWSKEVQKQKADVEQVNPMVENAFWGNVGGCLGETSSLALLIGGAYLLIRRTISFHIPAAVLIAAFVFAAIFYWMDPTKYSAPLLHLFGGGMLICAFFIATDPVTAPLSVKGMWIFGAGVGALIMLIRLLGEYPEGVMYAVLIMNAVAPLIDRACKLVRREGNPMSNKIKTNPVLFFLQESWLLMVAAIAFGCLLACLNAAWQPKIAQNEIDKFNTLAGRLITEATEFQSIDQTIPVDIGKGKVFNVDVKKGTDAAGNTIGWAFVCEGPGFADKIKLVVGTDAAFEKLAGFGVLASNETPGFGDKINIKPEEGGFYQPQFVGAPVTELTLTKLGDDKKIDSQIVAISGATVTSEAVVKIFNTFLVPIKEQMQSEGLLSNQ